MTKAKLKTKLDACGRRVATLEGLLKAEQASGRRTEEMLQKSTHDRIRVEQDLRESAQALELLARLNRKARVCPEARRSASAIVQKWVCEVEVPKGNKGKAEWRRTE